MPFVIQTQRALLRLTGEDTLPFLQGLVTNDVSCVQEKGLLYAALLTPQGKYLHDFFLWAYDGGVVIDIDKHRLADLVQRLKMYRLRSRVQMEALPDDQVVAVLWQAEKTDRAPVGIRIFPDPRCAGLGIRAMGDRESLRRFLEGISSGTSDVDYERLRHELGIPDGMLDMEPDKSFPMQFGFEDLHAIDFKKGCYVGQEVTSRTKHLGQVRKFLYRVESNSPLPPRGTPIQCGEEKIGELLSHSGTVGLALLQVADVKKARESGDGLQCGGVGLSARLSIWVRNSPEA